MIFKQNFRVYYNHTDSGGVVYHSNYITFCEQARTEFLRSNGLEQLKLVHENNLLFVVTNINASFKYPARLDDFITVTIEEVIIKDPKITMLQKIYNNDKLLFTCNVELVTISSDYKLYRKIPDFIKEKLCLQN